MTSTTSDGTASKAALWTGRVLSLLVALLLIFSGVMKVMKHPDALKGFIEMGFVESHLLPVGVIEIACTVIYLIPRTSALGAILLTGYLGGATVTVMRSGSPVMCLLPVILGVVVWAGLYLRDHRLRTLIPLRGN